MFARSVTSERTAALSSRWTASASRESAPKTDPPSITDKIRILSAFRLIGRLRASLKSRMKLDFEVLHHGCMRQSSSARGADEELVCQSVFALVQICTNVANIV